MVKINRFARNIEIKIGVLKYRLKAFKTFLKKLCKVLKTIDFMLFFCLNGLKQNLLKDIYEIYKFKILMPTLMPTEYIHQKRSRPLLLGSSSLVRQGQTGMVVNAIKIYHSV